MLCTLLLLTEWNSSEVSLTRSCYTTVQYNLQKHTDHSTHSRTLLSLKWISFAAHTQARWLDIFNRNQRQTIWVISPTEQGDRFTLSPAYCALCFCTVASQRHACWPNKPLCVRAYLCVSLEQEREGEGERVADTVDMLPVMVSERRPWSKDSQCGFSSQSC